MDEQVAAVHRQTAGRLAEQVAVVRGGTRRLVVLDGRVGGLEVARVALRQVDVVWERVRPHRWDPGRGRDVQAAAAELAQVAGWILFDVECQAEAGRVNAQALGMARLAGDRSTELLTLLTISMREAHLGRPREALAVAEFVLEGGRLGPRVEAMFRVRAARALGLAGDRAGAATQFRRARSLVLDGPGRADPAWAWWIDETELVGHEGAARIDRADWSGAVPLLESVAHAGSAGAPQYRSVFTAKLLLAYLKAHAWSDAERVAGDLLDHRGIGSRRTAGVLRRAGRVARTDPRLPSSLSDLILAVSESTTRPHR